MKTTLEKVYACDHCGKKTRSASSTSRHERFCPKNPINKHICFDWCYHLKREVVIDMTTDWEWGTREPGGQHTEFTCTAKHIKMYSYLLEKKRDPIFGKLTRMPLDCNLYLAMTEHEKQEKNR